MCRNIKTLFNFDPPATTDEVHASSLHIPGKPDTKRTEHLSGVTFPMLFLSGTPDTLAEFELLHPVIKKVGKKATPK
jgi:uncharacterized protein DUF2277